MESPRKTILVVDDEKDIVEMIRYNLRKEGYDVLVAHDGRSALEHTQEQPDLILLDVMMPGMDGLSVVRQLKRQPATESIPIIFLTAKGTETDEVVGLELGADDYIVKPVSMGKLLARIRALFRRQEQAAEPQQTAETITIDDLEIDVPKHRVRVCGSEVSFVRKEFDLLVFLAHRRGRVVTRDDILTGVWGPNVYVVERTVDVHIRKIREKLGACAGYIETIKGVGYRFRE